MNYSEFYGTGDDAKRLKLILMSYDEEYARQMKTYPEQKNALTTQFKSYSNLVINQLNSYTESGESAPSGVRMLGIVFKKNLNVAAKYELINPVEFSTYTDAAKSFYVSQNLDVSEYFDNSENSTELFNRIHASQDNPTGITYLDSSGSLVR